MLINRTRNVVLAGTVGLLLALGACGTDSSEPLSEAAEAEGPLAELIEAAQEEGELVYYSSEVDAVNQAVVEAFQEEYGITVEVLRLASGPLASRFAEEVGAGGSPADVFRSADGAAFATNPEWFVELSPEVIPQLVEYPDSAYGETRTDVLTQYSTYVFTYNTELVDEADLPETWEDVLDSEWAGNLVLSDPRSSISWLAWVDAMVNEHGPEFAEQISEQDWDLVDSAAPGAQQVAAGAYMGSLPAFTGHAAPVIEDGAPLDFVTPTDPMPLKADHIGLVADSPNPNAARLFLDFRLREEALQITCELNDVAAPLPNIPGCLETPENPEVVKDVWTPEESEEIFDLLGLPSA